MKTAPPRLLPPSIDICLCKHHSLLCGHFGYLEIVVSAHSPWEALSDAVFSVESVVLFCSGQVVPAEQKIRTFTDHYASGPR
eukprot:s1671_g6.t1